MRNGLSFTLLAVVAGVCFSLPAAADEPAPEPAGVGAAISPNNPHGLTRVHGDLTAGATSSAGAYRSVELAARAPTVARPVRPAPSPRVLRRMNTEHALAGVELQLRACANESTTVAPTAFGLRVSVGPTGEVESAELASAAKVPAAVLACAVKAVSGARFGAPGAAGAAIAVPVSIPGRTPSSAASASPAMPTSNVTATVITPAIAPTPVVAPEPLPLTPP